MSDVFVPVIGSDYPDKVIPLLEGAKKSIDIVMYDWRWYPNQPGHAVQRFNIALVNAVNRGVQVRAVVNLAEALPILVRVGIKARKMRDHRTVHTKMLLVDNITLVLGSHNITRNAFGANVETSLIVSVPDSEGRFKQFFENLYSI